MESTATIGVSTPEFLQGLAHSHYARLTRCVVLTGNIYDLFPIAQEGKTKFVPLDDLLEGEFHKAKYPHQKVDEKFAVMNVKSDGTVFSSEDEVFESFLQGVKNKLKEKGMTSVSSLGNIQVISIFLREIVQRRSKSSDETIRPICVIVDHAETIFPNVDAGRMSAQQVESWKWFSDLIREEKLWPDEETADERPDLIILLSPTTAELNPKILNLPKTELIEIPLPSGSYGILPSEFEDDARGLTLRAMTDLATASRRDRLNSPLTRQAIVAEVTKRLAIELKDTVKLIRPQHSMSDLIGSSKIIPRLRHLARWIDDPKRAPAGMVVTGPNGAGKTFRLEAWAADMGRTVFALAGGMKSKWYGETGRSIETLEMFISVYGRTCVFVDEAHKAFASIHDPDTHQADAEYARHMIQMMSNPKYRSKVFWVLITTRPDLLDPDIKRPGRCSLFVPILDPEGEDAEDFFKWMIRSFEEKDILLDEETKAFLREKTLRKGHEFSAGEYRRLIDDMIYEKDYKLNELKTVFDPKEFIQTWRPSSFRIGKERRFQTLLAVKDADWPELISSEFANKSEEEIVDELEDLKFSLRY